MRSGITAALLKMTLIAAVDVFGDEQAGAGPNR